jgi:quercetin dioxygenase-like cupin family protein
MSESHMVEHRMTPSPQSPHLDQPSGAPLEPVILRVFTDTAGQSRFEDIRLPGASRRSEVSTSVAWLSEKVAVRGMVWRRVEEEAPSTVPHNAPRRQLILPLSGQVEIEVGTGERRRVRPGQLILVEDTTGAGHITRAVGDEPRVTLMLELGDEPFPGV